MVVGIVNEMKSPEPLRWCVDWKHLKPIEQMMMGFPLIGTQRRIYADMIRQLKTRNSEDQSAWETCPKETRDLADRIVRILIEHLGWPKNTIFLPDDPADIAFWDRTGDMAGVEAILAAEEVAGVEMGDGFWASLSQMTFSQVVQMMKDREAEPRAAAYRR